MARIRTIKPHFFTDEHLSALPPETQLLAAGLLCYADDEGYFNANPKLVEAAIFPTRELSLSTHGMLSELCDVGYIEFAEGPDGRKYGRIVSFAAHQRINRPTPSLISKLQLSWSTHPQLSESSLQKNVGIRNKEGNKKSTPPNPLKEGEPKNKKSLSVYNCYPRKIGRNAAIRAIEKAARRLIAGERGSPTANYDEAITYLCQRAALFARAPAGNNGEYTPHPATWFNGSRYLDDESEWSKGHTNGQNQRNGNASLGKQADRNEVNRDAILAGIFGGHAGGNAAPGGGAGENDAYPGRVGNVGKAGPKLLT